MADLALVQPMHVAAYIEQLGTVVAKPTVKQHLAAIRMLFDSLVTGQVNPLNPAHAVRGPRHSVKKRKTSVLAAEEMRQLLASIETSPPSLPTLPSVPCSLVCPAQLTIRVA